MATDPRVSTLTTLLHGCGHDLEAVTRPGGGIDRTQIREMLALSPTERVAQLRKGAHFLELLDAAGARLRSSRASKKTEDGTHSAPYPTGE